MVGRLESLHRFSGAGRALFLVIAVGALAIPLTSARAVDTAVVAPAAVHTRAVSCFATAFRPIDSGSGYGIGGANVLYWTGGGSPNFHCNPGLPHKAVVSKLAVTSSDYSTSGEMGACRLTRFDLTAAGTLPLTMATVAGTGIAAAPGRVRRSTSAISAATIDNTKYAYAIVCLLPADPSAGLYGAAVTFTITDANG